jgi:hypothetical protein
MAFDASNAIPHSAGEEYPDVGPVALQTPYDMAVGFSSFSKIVTFYELIWK